jgi:hypothetical protein
MAHGEFRTIAVSSPCGAPRQFRVQFRPDGSSAWRRSGVFGEYRLACQCAQQLEQSGKVARVIPYRLPAAA